MPSKQQADQSPQDMWEQYKQKYMTPAKTTIEISAQKPSKTTPQSAAQATSQLASEATPRPANKSVSKSAIQLSDQLASQAECEQTPGKQCAQQQKHIASQPPTQSTTQQASPLATSQLAKQSLPHASLHADLLPAEQAGPLDYHICKLCNAAFSSIARLICHTQNITCNKPRCKLCEQTFASKNQLHQHLRTECKYSKNNRQSSNSAARKTALSPYLPARTSHSVETSSSRPTVSAMPTAPATPPATPPPTYRAVSAPPPAYKAAKKAYLTIEDLYMRYAPLKALRSARQSAHQSACSKATATSSYLTIHDLFRRFSKRTSAKSMSKQYRYVLDLETSAIDSVRSRKSNTKTSNICFLPQVQNCINNAMEQLQRVFPWQTHLRDPPSLLSKPPNACALQTSPSPILRLTKHLIM